jgi:hypothetical protein
MCSNWKIMLTIKHATRPIKGIETHISQIVRNFMRSQTLPFFSVSFGDGGATLDGGGNINFG